MNVPCNGIPLIALKTDTREWIRVSGIATECTDLKVKQKMLDECPTLGKDYSAADAAHYIVNFTKFSLQE